MKFPLGCGELCNGVVQELMSARMTMTKGMAFEHTCDINVDFARAMIWHHNGAAMMCNAFMKSAKEAEGPGDLEAKTICNGISDLTTDHGLQMVHLTDLMKKW